MALKYYVKCLNDDDPSSVTEEWIELRDVPVVTAQAHTTSAINAMPKVLGCIFGS